ncbi:MAG: hypothetical protein JJU23_15450, partial [Cyclobacteriaceae bacterium]|nr:hypothetical protein [Cyclobacteriaceae bacterium]
QYAPALGRFWSVDPLADHSNQVDKSPYAAFWNNPIIFTDPDGRCPDCPDPSTANEGDIVNPNGGMDFIFTNGEWTGIGGTLNEVTVTASRSENNGGFGSGFADGFGAGIGSTVDFFKSLGTTQGWKDLGQGMLDMAMLSCQTCPEGMMMRAQMADRTINYIQNIPNMSAYEMGYDLGFGTEKLAEAVLISKGAGFGINAARYGLGEAMWQSSALGSRSLLFGRYHSQFVPNGRRGVLNTGIQTGIGWSNHGSRHVFRAKYNGTKIFQIYK